MKQAHSSLSQDSGSEVIGIDRAVPHEDASSTYYLHETIGEHQIASIHNYNRIAESLQENLPDSSSLTTSPSAWTWVLYVPAVVASTVAYAPIALANRSISVARTGYTTARCMRMTADTQKLGDQELGLSQGLEQALGESKSAELLVLQDESTKRSEERYTLLDETENKTRTRWSSLRTPLHIAASAATTGSALAYNMAYGAVVVPTRVATYPIRAVTEIASAAFRGRFSAKAEGDDQGESKADSGKEVQIGFIEIDEVDDLEMWVDGSDCIVSGALGIDRIVASESRGNNEHNEGMVVESRYGSGLGSSVRGFITRPLSYAHESISTSSQYAVSAVTALPNRIVHGAANTGRTLVVNSAMISYAATTASLNAAAAAVPVASRIAASSGRIAASSMRYTLGAIPPSLVNGVLDTVSVTVSRSQELSARLMVYSTLAVSSALVPQMELSRDESEKVVRTVHKAMDVAVRTFGPANVLHGAKIAYNIMSDETVVDCLTFSRDVVSELINPENYTSLFIDSVSGLVDAADEISYVTNTRKWSPNPAITFDYSDAIPGSITADGCLVADEPHYFEAEIVHEEKISNHFNGDSSAANDLGETIAQFTFDVMDSIFDGLLVAKSNDERTALRTSKPFQSINLDEELSHFELLEPEYDEVSPCSPFTREKRSRDVVELEEAISKMPELEEPEILGQLAGYLRAQQAHQMLNSQEEEGDDLVGSAFRFLEDVSSSFFSGYEEENTAATWPPEIDSFDEEEDTADASQDFSIEQHSNAVLSSESRELFSVEILADNWEETESADDALDEVPVLELCSFTGQAEQSETNARSAVLTRVVFEPETAEDDAWDDQELANRSLVEGQSLSTSVPISSGNPLRVVRATSVSAENLGDLQLGRAAEGDSQDMTDNISANDEKPISEQSHWESDSWGQALSILRVADSLNAEISDALPGLPITGIKTEGVELFMSERNHCGNPALSTTCGEPALSVSSKDDQFAASIANISEASSTDECDDDESCLSECASSVKSSVEDSAALIQDRDKSAENNLGSDEPIISSSRSPYHVSQDEESKPVNDREGEETFVKIYRAANKGLSLLEKKLAADDSDCSSDGSCNSTTSAGDDDEDFFTRPIADFLDMLESD